MMLPNGDRAEVPREKIVSYLLSATHPSGRDKAAFFARFGFARARWRVLAEALRRHAVAVEVTRAEPSPFGTRFVIEAPMLAPDGRSPRVRSVRFIEHGDEVPRFVTAYPA